MTDPGRVARGAAHGGTSSITGVTRVPSQVSTNATATGTTTSISPRYTFAPISPSKLASRSAAGSTADGRKPPLPAKLHGRGLVSYAKPRRTVRLLEGTPCYLPSCPAWIKSPFLWSPRFSPRQVDVKTLGFGRHGSQVLLVRQLSMGGTAVMKQFVREKLVATPRLHDKVLNEWRVHNALVPHPNIVPLYGAVEDKSYVTLVLEAQRGDVLWYLDETDRKTLSEDEARNVAADVLSALTHMHDMGFVHRDVKAENVFAAPRNSAGLRYGSTSGGGGAAAAAVTAAAAAAPEPVSSWRLGDLGSAVELAEVTRPGAPGLHLEGSPPFLAPEYAALWVAPPASRTAHQLQRATSPKQDIWAVGALVYDMLIGHPPFSGPDPSAEPPLPQLATAILSLPPSPTPDAAAAAGTISAAAAAFLTAALRKAPEERPTAVELLSHPWLTEAPMAPTGLTSARDRVGAASAGGGSVAGRGGDEMRRAGGGATSAAEAEAAASSTAATPESPSAVAVDESVAAEAGVAVAASTAAASTGPVELPEVTDPWVVTDPWFQRGAISGAVVGPGTGPGTEVSQGAEPHAELGADVAGGAWPEADGDDGHGIAMVAGASSPSTASAFSNPRAAAAATTSVTSATAAVAVAAGMEPPESGATGTAVVAPGALEATAATTAATTVEAAVAEAAAAAEAAEAVAAEAVAAEPFRASNTAAATVSAASLPRKPRKARTTTRAAADGPQNGAREPPPPPPPAPTQRVKRRPVVGKPEARRRRPAAAVPAAAAASDTLASPAPSASPSQRPSAPVGLQAPHASELERGQGPRQGMGQGAALGQGMGMGSGLDGGTAQAQIPEAAAAAAATAAAAAAVGRRDVAPDTVAVPEPAGGGQGGEAMAGPVTAAVSELQPVKRKGTTRRRQPQAPAAAVLLAPGSPRGARKAEAAAVNSALCGAATVAGAAAWLATSTAGQVLVPAATSAAATAAAAAALPVAGSGTVVAAAAAAAAATEAVAGGTARLESDSRSVFEEMGPEAAAAAAPAAAAVGPRSGRPRARARTAAAAVAAAATSRSRRRGSGSACSGGPDAVAVTASVMAVAATTAAAHVAEAAGSAQQPS